MSAPSNLSNLLMYSITRPLCSSGSPPAPATCTAVRMSRFCRFLLCANSESGRSTIFSSSSMSSFGRFAVMKALTVHATASEFLQLGNAVDTTWPRVQGSGFSVQGAGFEFEV